MLTTRELKVEDAKPISDAFAEIGWNKPTEKYLQLVDDYKSGRKWVRMACVNDNFAGYVTVVPLGEYSPFRDQKIPEIQDLNVLPKYRNKGIASRLLDEAEAWISGISQIAGIGVGLHDGYRFAQRIYSKRGYILDGKGVTHQGRYVKEGETIPFDDDLVIWMTKNLRGVK